MFDYFYGQSGEMFSYFRVPKILFRDIKFKDLSTDAKNAVRYPAGPHGAVGEKRMAALYNAPTTMQLYYQNQTNHDLSNRG